MPYFFREDSEGIFTQADWLYIQQSKNLLERKKSEAERLGHAERFLRQVKYFESIIKRGLSTTSYLGHSARFIQAISMLNSIQEALPYLSTVCILIKSLLNISYYLIFTRANSYSRGLKITLSVGAASLAVTALIKLTLATPLLMASIAGDIVNNLSDIGILLYKNYFAHREADSEDYDSRILYNEIKMEESELRNSDIEFLIHAHTKALYKENRLYATQYKQLQKPLTFEDQVGLSMDQSKIKSEIHFINTYTNMLHDRNMVLGKKAHKSMMLTVALAGAVLSFIPGLHFVGLVLLIGISIYSISDKLNKNPLKKMVEFILDEPFISPKPIEANEHIKELEKSADNICQTTAKTCRSLQITPDTTPQAPASVPVLASKEVKKAPNIILAPENNLSHALAPAYPTL